MSDFLTRLAQRQLGQIAVIEPRVPALYAPVTAATPLPVIEEAPTEGSNAPRIARALAVVAGSNATHGPAAVVSNIGYEEETTEVASPTQQLVTQLGEEHVSLHAVENVGAAVLPQLAPKLAVLERQTDLSLPAQSETGQPEPLAARPEAHASQLVFTREAPPRLMDAGAVTPVAAPPRLERAMPNRDAMAALERERADSEPPVHVTIGRIEVTAVTAAPAPRRTAIARKPSMSLDDYLARRQRRES